MLEQSVKLSRVIIFSFISNFLIYAPILRNREPKTSAFRSVFVFRAVFSSSTVVSVAKANVPQMPTIAVFARNWSGADPNFDPFRWPIWLALSELLCLLANQNVFSALNYLFSAPCYLKTAFLLAMQSQSRNFFLYIIIQETVQYEMRHDCFSFVFYLLLLHLDIWVSNIFINTWCSGTVPKYSNHWSLMWTPLISKLLQSATAYFITKCDGLLLESATAFLLQCDKIVLLRSVTGTL